MPRYTIAPRTVGPSNQTIRSTMPVTAIVQTSTSSTLRVAPDIPRTITPVYVPAMATRIVAWSSRRSSRRSRANRLGRW